MSKSHAKELSNVFRHLFRDSVDAFPALEADLGKDLDRLLRTVDHRGIHLYMVDLPALGKHFDKCLAGGRFTEYRGPLGKRTSAQSPITRFLRGLMFLVFDSSGCLREDANSEAVFFIRQVCYLGKKAVLECGDDAVEREFIDFFTTDGALPEPSEFWESRVDRADPGPAVFGGFSESARYRDRATDRFRMEAVSATFLGTLDFVSGVITSSLGSYDPKEWRFRHGPGAVAERTGTFNKYCWTNWSDRLDAEFPVADYGFHSYSAWAHRLSINPWTSEEVPSRLIAVPKTLTKPRLIAAEPSENQWCQQNIWHYLRTRVSNTWINDFVRFGDQRLNQELCIRGSRDGSLCTIDLSSASDRVTCECVARTFRSNPRLLRAMRACRTRFISQDRFTTCPKVWKLRKFSTMGSACTFPVQSLIFLSVALSSVLCARRVKPTVQAIKALAGEVAVFGDDIIVPADSREFLVHALEVLDFKVNIDKSFWTGRFRESCGVDAFNGDVVTPVYWRDLCTRNADSIASTIDVGNNFYKKFLLRTAQYVRAPLERFKIPHVGMESEVVGQISRVRPERQRGKTRWNRMLHRDEIYLPVITSRARRSPIHDDTALLQYFTEAPPSYQKWVGGVTQKARLTLRWVWVPLESLANR